MGYDWCSVDPMLHVERDGQKANIKVLIKAMRAEGQDTVGRSSLTVFHHPEVSVSVSGHAPEPLFPLDITDEATEDYGLDELGFQLVVGEGFDADNVALRLKKIGKDNDFDLDADMDDADGRVVTYSSAWM